MALHHRREMPDMRAYARDQAYRSSPSNSVTEMSYQDLHSGSDRSYETQPTSYSSCPSKRPPIVHYTTSESQHKDTSLQVFNDRQPQESPRSSVDTYASTVHSEEEQPKELQEYDVPEYTARPYESSVFAATPSDFSQVFPSQKRLAIRHDDSTLDGNMNLRVDTEVSLHDGDGGYMTLFHLRMHDLKKREFSLRRYCRDSGREVCHSVRKHQKPTAEKRPSFQRSLSSALNSMRPKSEHKNSGTATLASLKRNDSGYDSMHSVNFDEDDRPTSYGQRSKPEETKSTNTVRLEFSNYAQVDVKRAGVTDSKRYEFEYWGTRYIWKRVSRKVRGHKETTYQLVKSSSDNVLAYIKPLPLTSRQAQEELGKGGWIPPCSMWIADKNIVSSQKDVSDVVIASGLMALVDDSIRAHFHSENEKQLLIPKLQMGVEYVGPKRLINEMFGRKGGSANTQSRPSSSGRPSTDGSASTRGPRRPTGSFRQPSGEY